MADLTPDIPMDVGDIIVSDVNTDLGCYRTVDPDMALTISTRLDDTTALGVSTGHSDLYGPSCSMIPILHQGHRL